MIATEEFGGAMENWGLIYYQVGGLLGGDFASASLIAHELVHQWFGNLVTMKWLVSILFIELFSFPQVGSTIPQ